MSRGVRNILLGCGCLGVVVCVCAVVAATQFGGALGEFFANLDIGGFVEQVLSEPYGVGERPLPASAGVQDLLPVEVSGFRRGNPVSGNGQSAIYSGESGNVRVRAVWTSSVGQAQAQVEAVGQQTESGTTERLYNPDQDPSYVRAVFTNGQARMAYSRQNYFFDMQADNRAALDAFMNAFPY